MAGCINQVKNVIFALVFIFHLDSVGLDGNALFALQIHIIQHLCLHLAVGERARKLQKPVGQRAFAVVNVGYNAKIPDVLHS
jgi:hypothetical protein